MLEFCIRPVLSATRHEPFRNPSKVHWRKIPSGARYNELQNLVEHMFSVYIELISAVLTLRTTWKKIGIMPSGVKISYRGPNCSEWMFTWQISKHWSACLWILRRTLEVTGFCVHSAQCQMNITVFFHVLCNCRYKFCVRRKRAPQDFVVRCSERRVFFLNKLSMGFESFIRRAVETAALIQNSNTWDVFPLVSSWHHPVLFQLSVSIFVVFQFWFSPLQFALLVVFLFDPRRRRCTGLTGIEVSWRLAALIVMCDDHFLPSVYFSP